jgi:hypothetical protein
MKPHLEYQMNEKTGAFNSTTIIIGMKKFTLSTKAQTYCCAFGTSFCSMFKNADKN